MVVPALKGFISVKKEIKKVLSLFSLLIIILILGISTLTPIYAANDYILSSGSLGATTWNNNLIELKAGHNYYFTFETTESISVTALILNVWNYSNPPQAYDYNYTKAGILWLVAHIDLSIYEGSAATNISPTNILIKIWSNRFEIQNLTNQDWTINPANYGGRAVSTKSNAIIAVAFSPSIDIWVNGTNNTSFTQYEENNNDKMILSLRESLQSRMSFYILWNLVKGALSSNIAYPVTVSAYDPKTIVYAFATETGFSSAAMGIGVFSFALLSVTVLLYSKKIEVTALIFGFVTLGLVSTFAYLEIIPFWFTLPIGMLCISLLGFDVVSERISYK